MGGGALMTPALIFLGVGGASTVVTADLTAAAIYKSGGAITHAREGQPNWTLAKWLIIGSVPFALAGPWLLHAAPSGTPADIDTVLKECIGFALLFAAATLRPPPGHQPAAHAQRRARRPTQTRYIRPLPTIAIGAMGGLLVGITSVGSGSVIMISLVILYPGLSALRLVGTDLVQAVPLVIAAAISNIALNGLDWHILDAPGHRLAAGQHPGQPDRAARAAVATSRRGIVIVLTMSGLACRQVRLGARSGSGEDDTHPVFLALVGVGAVVRAPAGLGPDPAHPGACRCSGRPPVTELEGDRPRARNPQRSAVSEEPATISPRSR